MAVPFALKIEQIVNCIEDIKTQRTLKYTDMYIENINVAYAILSWPTDDASSDALRCRINMCSKSLDRALMCLKRLGYHNPRSKQHLLYKKTLNSFIKLDYADEKKAIFYCKESLERRIRFNYDGTCTLVQYIKL